MIEDIETRCAVCTSKGRGVEMQKQAEGYLWCPVCGDVRWPCSRPPKPSERILAGLHDIAQAATTPNPEAIAALVPLACKLLGEPDPDRDPAPYVELLIAQTALERDARVPWGRLLDCLLEERYQRQRARDEADRDRWSDTQQRGVEAEERIASALERIARALEATHE